MSACLDEIQNPPISHRR